MPPRPVLDLEIAPRRRELALEVLAGLPDALVYFLAAVLVQMAWSLSRNLSEATALIVPWLAALLVPFAAFELAYAWPRRRGLRLHLDARGLVAEVGGRTFTAGWPAVRARDNGSAMVIFFAAWTPGLVLPHRLLTAEQRAQLAQLLDDAGIAVARGPLTAVRNVAYAGALATAILLATSWLTIAAC